MACPAAFENVIAACKEQVCEVVNSILPARPSCYDSRDPRANLIAMQHAACGPSPRRTLRTVVSLSTTSWGSLSTNQGWQLVQSQRRRQQLRNATGRRHVDSSGITADKMLDYFESQDRPADGGPITHRCFHLHCQFVDEHEGCPHADPRSAASSTDIPDAPWESCTAVARARLELGAVRFLHSLQPSPLIAPSHLLLSTTPRVHLRAVN